LSQEYINTLHKGDSDDDDDDNNKNNKLCLCSVLAMIAEQSLQELNPLYTVGHIPRQLAILDKL
jgi:hypothetical protein